MGGGRTTSRGKGGKGASRSDKEEAVEERAYDFDDEDVGKAATSRGKGGKGLGKGGESMPPPADPTPADPAPLSKTESEIATKDNLITSFVSGAKSNAIEVVFAFDTTGSMNAYLAEVRTKLKETCTKLMKDIPSIKIGLMAFGDYCDYNNYVVSSKDLCRDTDMLVKWVDTVGGTGGGDEPEAYELAMREARKLSWTKGKDTNVNKAFVIIGDAPPHAPSYTTENIYWRDELAELVKEGVKVYGVLCNNSVHNQPFFEEVAEESGGFFLTLKHLQLITDMFLAVCYREFGAEHLETFRTEVADGGRMNEGMETIFNQLEEGPTTNEKVGKRSTASWYHKSFDKGSSPQYTFDPATNKWKPYSGKVTKTTAPTPPASGAKKRKDDGDSSPTPAKKKKTATKETKVATPKKSPKTTKKETKGKATKETKAKGKGKKAKDDDEEEEEEKVERKEKKEKKTVKKTESIIVGTGEWKRDRHGRMASLHD